MGLLMLVVLISGLIAAGGFYLYQHTRPFWQVSELSPPGLYRLIKTEINQPPVSDDGKINFLLLGTDSLITRGDVPPLTDSIILLSFDLNSGNIRQLPLPRDLWLTEYKTKINALLAYGYERNPTNPSEFPTTVISELVGAPIHHTLIISLDSLEQLIDVLGGVEVTVEEAFTDDQFPRPDVDIKTVTDPQLLYQTVSFAAGLQVMSGERALQFIRSRHSAGNQGSDDARSIRQQQVFKAILTKISNLKYWWRNPAQLGRFYRWYLDTYQANLPISEIIRIGGQIIQNKHIPKLSATQLSIQAGQTQGVLVHPYPSRIYQNQWVYLISDVDKFKQEIDNKLFGKPIKNP